MRPSFAAPVALFLLLAGCHSGGPPGGGGITHLLSNALTPDATVTFSVTGSTITLSCTPACTGPKHDTLTTATNKNVKFTAPGNDLTVLSFELKGNSDVLPFDSNPSTVTFHGSGSFNTRHDLPNGGNSQPYYYHVFLFDPTTNSTYYADPLIIIGR